MGGLDRVAITAPGVHEDAVPRRIPGLGCPPDGVALDEAEPD